MDHFASWEFVTGQKDAIWWRSWFQLAAAFGVGLVAAHIWW
jgi:hypothetical protein